MKSKAIRDVSLAKAIKIVWTGRGVTPLMLATTDLEEAQLRLLDSEKSREAYDQECKMLQTRIARLKRYISQFTSESEQ
jgi:hypothetical protein